MSRIGTLEGGRQAPRRESLIRLAFGVSEGGALAVSSLAVALAIYAVHGLGLASPEAIVRTAHLGALWNGFDTSPLAFGIERPPLTTALALPLAAFPALRDGGLAVALGTALAAGCTVLAASGIARRAGFARPAATIFIVTFALQPLLLYSSAVGLPEAIYSALVLASAGRFLQWLRDDAARSVIGAGVAIAAAFLLRYNSVLIVGALAGAFWWVASHRGIPALRVDAAQATSVAFMTPVAFVVGLWALTAWFPYGNLTEFLTRADGLSALAGDDIAQVHRMATLTGNPLTTITWVGGWSLAIAPLSFVAIVALVAWAVLRRDRAAAALAVVLASLPLPEFVSVLTGHGQPLVSHLFVVVVPAFVVVAYVEQLRSGGVRPSSVETRRHRNQLLLVAPLLLGLAIQVLVLTRLPATDGPARAFIGAVTADAPVLQAPDALAAARWINQNAGPGDVVVDWNRSAEVMIASGRFDRFRTAADNGEEATLYNPFGIANYMLVRRPTPDAGTGPIERAHPDLWETGGGFASLVLDAGRFRIYHVDQEPQR